jgi:hypothetical protein
MSMLLLIAMAGVGMGLVAAISLTIYAVLPHTALKAAEHGRYAGLGTRDDFVNHTPGNRPIAQAGSLQGQSA